MSDPFSIRIFVPDGDPEGVRIVDRMNWTGCGIIVPRDQWARTKQRNEFDQAGVYILAGYEEDEEGEDRLVLYVGQTDELRKRINQHDAGKDFWDRVIAFTSTVNLNRAHITWLEWALYTRAAQAGKCRLDNSSQPVEPHLSEPEKADTSGFLLEVLRIMPLVGLHAFESSAQRVATPAPITASGYESSNDTIIVPAKEDGFNRVFIGENAWWAIRIAAGMVPKLRYVAAYRSQPISAITHVAKIDRIEPYGDTGKKRILFAGPAEELAKPIPFGTAASGSMQSSRYTQYEKLKSARTVGDLFR